MKIDANINTLFKIIQVYFKQISLEEWETYSKNTVIDWHEVYRLAILNQIRPLLYNIIKIIKPLNFPTEINNELREFSFMMAIKSLNQLVQINEIQTEFVNQGINSVLHKGILYGGLFYESISDREVGDIDIIVKRQDLEKAHQILHSLGYIAPTLENGYNIGQFIHGLDYHVSYLCPNKGMYSLLELHWSHSSTRSIIDLQTDCMIDSKTNWVINGNTIPAPTIEDILLLLITHHSSKEGWVKLRYVCDFIGLFLQYHNSIDWKTIYNLAHKSNLLPHLNIGLNLFTTFGKHIDVGSVNGILIPLNYALIEYHAKFWSGRKKKSKYHYFYWSFMIHRNIKTRLKIANNHFIRSIYFFLEKRVR